VVVEKAKYHGGINKKDSMLIDIVTISKQAGRYLNYYADTLLKMHNLFTFNIAIFKDLYYVTCRIR